MSCHHRWLASRYLCGLEGAMGMEPHRGGGLYYEPHLGAQSAGDRVPGSCPEGASAAGSRSVSATAGKNH